jgi:cystathionine beta-lyase/cystathionine gamma-synthase
MKYVNESTQKIAEWLESYPGTRFVWYPGLPSTPNHEIAKKQMTGYGGVISFAIKGTVQQHFDFLTKLQLITSAVSLGHDETLILYLSPEDERNYLYPEPHKEGFYRFAIGLEDTEDIIEDLRQAFEQVGL